jgi:hypothetical protein
MVSLTIRMIPTHGTTKSLALWKFLSSWGVLGVIVQKTHSISFFSIESSVSRSTVTKINNKNPDNKSRLTPSPFSFKKLDMKLFFSLLIKN